MEEFLEEVNKTIKSWAEMPSQARWTFARERALHKLRKDLEKYTLLQLDILTTLRGMSRAVAREIQTIKDNR